jgi:type IV pilus assembly protein PilN
MYSIDINFLKDRKLEAQTGTAVQITGPPVPINERIPIIIGMAVGVALVAASVGASLVINQQKARTEQEIQALKNQIAGLQGQNEEVQQLETQIKAVSQNTEALVSVFKNIKPWSALLAEISLVIPPGVQIQSISQSDNKTLTISGIASSYDRVNDFVLSLKNSRFLNAEKTKLNNSNFTKNPNAVKFTEEEIAQAGQGQTEIQDVLVEQAQPIVELPEVINYNITVELSDIPASELINTLNRRGAIGLVTRMNILERKGALKP